jgi:hypothetical protein
MHYLATTAPTASICITRASSVARRHHRADAQQAQFLNDRRDRAASRTQPSRYCKPDDKQAVLFEMVNLSHERGLEQPAPHAE